MSYQEFTIEGRNAVIEAFRSGKTIDKLFLLDGCQDGPIQTIKREAKKHDTIVKFVDKERLDGFCRTNDGFEIARQDLAQRGAGELLGARQSGMDELMSGLMSAGPELIEETHEEARRMLRDDSPASAQLVLEARRLFEKDAARYGVN